MAAFTLTNGQILVGSFDASSFVGQFNQTSSARMVPSKVWGGGGFGRQYPGDVDTTGSLSGEADYASGGIAAAFTPATLGTQQLISVQPQGGAAAGDASIFTRGLINMIAAPGGADGDLAAFDMAWTGDTAIVYGQVAAPLTARTATANGSVITMTGPTATQKVYAGLHITSVSGTTPSLTAKVQSATLAGFGSPTDRITSFTAANAAGWQFASATGAITDGFWRFVFTISGTTPSFTCMAVIGTAAI